MTSEVTWIVIPLDGYSEPRYVIENLNTHGYLSDNRGGAIHFLDKDEAQQVRDILSLGKTL